MDLAFGPVLKTMDQSGSDMAFLPAVAFLYVELFNGYDPGIDRLIRRVGGELGA